MQTRSGPLCTPCAVLFTSRTSAESPALDRPHPSQHRQFNLTGPRIVHAALRSRALNESDNLDAKLEYRQGWEAQSSTRRLGGKRHGDGVGPLGGHPEWLIKGTATSRGTWAEGGGRGRPPRCLECNDQHRPHPVVDKLNNKNKNKNKNK